MGEEGKVYSVSKAEDANAIVDWSVRWLSIELLHPICTVLFATLLLCRIYESRAL